MKWSCERRLLKNLRCSSLLNEETDKMGYEKRKPRGWKCMPYIIGNETFEKLASMGLMSNFTVFLVQKYNMQQIAAVNLGNIFFGTTNFAPLLGAFISDAYLGRFRTLAYSSIFSMLGMLVLMLSVTIPQFLPPPCSTTNRLKNLCREASDMQFAVLYFALFLLAIGAGGIRPCNLPFGVDQFDKSTEKGRMDLNSFFNWYYFTSMLAMVIGMTFTVYIQNSISWTIGFAIPAALMLLSLAIFFLGAKYYVYIAPEGSVFTSIAQVFVVAFKKHKMQLPSEDDATIQESLLYNPFNRSEHITKLHLTLQFKCLNKAAIICEGDLDSKGTIQIPWKICSVQEIEEVKCLLRIIPIWASGIICFLAISQQFTFTVLQGLTMDRHIGPKFEIPAGSITTISMISLTAFIPIYDRIIIPILRKFTNKESGITLLQRQGVGQFLSVLCMIVAAVVEKKRRDSVVPSTGMARISVWWLVPQLVMMGIAEAFNLIGQVEFYNRQFPEHMQALAGSFFFCSLAVASYLSTATVALVNRVTNKDGRKGWLEGDINGGKLDLFYYVIAAMGGLNMVYFVVCAHYYRYKEERKDRIREESCREVEIA